MSSKEEGEKLSSEQRLIASIVQDHFPLNSILCAIGYGSGVIKQVLFLLYVLYVLIFI